ncbi:hypothetical protein DFH27DRAFT_561755 [Peziza echinospora]|nr:hypothetical protein DFH27DRAFT_561755 [Peziza echinospora]
MDLNYEETEEVLQGYIEFYEQRDIEEKENTKVVIKFLIAKGLEGKKALGDSKEELANEKKESAKLLGPMREATNSLRRLKGEKEELEKKLEEEVGERKKAVMEELKQRNERDELEKSRKALRLQCIKQKKELAEKENRGMELLSTYSPVVTLVEKVPTLEIVVDNDVEMIEASTLPAEPSAPPPSTPKRKLKSNGAPTGGQSSNTGAAIKPWGRPKNWRKAEARKEKEKERSAAPAQAAMTKAVVIHAIPTGWNVGWVANTVRGRLGSVIGIRWLLGASRRKGKTASLVVVYLQNSVLVGNGARI